MGAINFWCFEGPSLTVKERYLRETEVNRFFLSCVVPMTTRARLGNLAEFNLHSAS